MRADDFLVRYLIRIGTTDVFGIPGGVILDFLYALNKYHTQIVPHLSYHEQAAAFEASGYAQSSGKLGVVYATRGPGLTNTITAIADAYSESIPVLIVTSHANKEINETLRFPEDQELDTISMFRSITKYSVRIDDIGCFKTEVIKACRMALEGRRGTVLIDVLSSVWKKEVPEGKHYIKRMINIYSENNVIEKLSKSIADSYRPVFLVGDGIRQTDTNFYMKSMAEKNKIPVLSSRCSQDIMPDSDMYFGYIGSHGIRYSNFIISKADLIISFGNRMSFPIDSPSFASLLKNKKYVWIDIDPSEFSRNIPNCECYQEDLRRFLPDIYRNDFTYQNKEMWYEVCTLLRKELYQSDVNEQIKKIAYVINLLKTYNSIVVDVGNNEFLVSRAYILSGMSNKIMYSKVYGALGCALPKAIGVYYSTKQSVLCIVGDQGIQLNIQELQYISSNRLPIIVLIINNYASGMIRDRETQRYNGKYVHTTYESGYSAPNYEEIANAYQIRYKKMEDVNIGQSVIYTLSIKEPMIIEMKIIDDQPLFPYLPYGNPIQKMFPCIEGYDYYDKI